MSTTVIDHHLDSEANVYRLLFEHPSGEVEEIVWAADDEQWEGKDALTVAAEQRVIISDLLRKRANDAAVAAEHAIETRQDLGGAGEEL